MTDVTVSQLWEIYQDIGRSNAGAELTGEQKAQLVVDLREAAAKLEEQLSPHHKTEHVIRGGDVVYIECLGERAVSELDALWSVKVNRDTLEPSSVDTNFVISAPSYAKVLELVLPVLGKDHDDYADSHWTVEPIGLDTRKDTSDKYVLSVGSW